MKDSHASAGTRLGRTAATKPPDAPLDVTLRDGTAVRVRPIVPADKGRLREGMRHLSSQSRYRRFMGAVTQLSEKQLRYLTEIDYVDHMAWGAFDRTVPGEPVLGIARYMRLHDEPTTAEMAVAVVDSHQGRGLGTLLLGFLAKSAAKSDVRTFRAYVLAYNTPMLNILRDLGGELCLDHREFQVDIPVPTDPDDLPNTAAGRVFKAVARGEVELVAPHTRPRAAASPAREKGRP